MKIGIILTSDIRSRAYIQKIHNQKIKLDKIILMNKNDNLVKISLELKNKSLEHDFDISINVKNFLQKNKIEFTEFNFIDINEPRLIQFIKKESMDVMIFTGGGILRKEILSSGPKFLHLHPGRVPDYKGSTCFYYSIINEGIATVTAFFMNETLDTGDIILQKTFPKPDHIFIDEVFDAHIRSETLIEVLKNNHLYKKELIKQDPLIGETYFIIHPVLKHVAFFRCNIER
jgi:methionyl-tRNA formyltransferase